MTHHFRGLVLVSVRLHVPDDLVSEQLRKLSCLDDVSLNISQNIISKRLHNLVDIEEHDIYRVALKCPHRILDDKWMVAISRHEQCYSRNRVQRCPIQQVLELEGDVAR